MGTPVFPETETQDRKEDNEGHIESSPEQIHKCRKYFNEKVRRPEYWCCCVVLVIASVFVTFLFFPSEQIDGSYDLFISNSSLKANFSAYFEFSGNLNCTCPMESPSVKENQALSLIQKQQVQCSAEGMQKSIGNSACYNAVISNATILYFSSTSCTDSVIEMFVSGFQGTSGDLMLWLYNDADEWNKVLYFTLKNENL